jgi:hypothetical protein
MVTRATIVIKTESRNSGMVLSRNARMILGANEGSRSGGRDSAGGSAQGAVVRDVFID